MPASLKTVRCSRCGEMVEVVPRTGVLKVHKLGPQVCPGSASVVESGGAGHAPRKAKSEQRRDEESIECPGCKRRVRVFMGVIDEHWKSEFGGAKCLWSNRTRP